MVTQYYKVKATLEHLQLAKPGQFVYKNNECDEIVGFIDFVSDCEIAILLFQPTEMDLEEMGAVNIAEEWEIIPRLKTILDQDPEIREDWKKLVMNYL